MRPLKISGSASGSGLELTAQLRNRLQRNIP